MEILKREPQRFYGNFATATLTAENTWTAPIQLLGDFALSISGAAWNAIVTLQWSFDSGATWEDVARYVSNTATRGTADAVGVLYRAGIKTGEHTSGSVTVRLAQ